MFRTLRDHAAALAAGVAAVITLGTVQAAAQPSTSADRPAAAPAQPVGVVVDRLACRLDPTQTYALYLPSSYTPSRRWPVLMLMDPRGRALIPLELFRAAAERHGYILVSSYDTASDGPAEPNITALKAMLPDTEERFAIDVRRHYLVGFSGTARISWDLATLLRSYVAGIVGIGGGFPAGYAPPAGAPFVFFGSAGNLDFNHDEMRDLDVLLDGLGLAHRLEYFDGFHSWPPEEVCGRAVAWLELQAQRSGLAEQDSAWLRELHTQAMERARRLESQGDVEAAHDGFAAVATDFHGLLAVEEAAERARHLAAGEEFGRIRARRQGISARRRAYDEMFTAYLQEFSRRPPPLIHSLRSLQLKNLEKEATGSEGLERDAAQRTLEHVFGFMSFYMPRDLLARGDGRGALAALQIAAEIHPHSPRICYGRARAHAMLRQKKKALQALECAATSGAVNAALLEGDPLLAPLRGEDGYRKILKTLGGGDVSAEPR